MNVRELRDRISAATEAAQRLRDTQVDDLLKAQARGQADAYGMVSGWSRELTYDLPPERRDVLDQLEELQRSINNELRYVYQYRDGDFAALDSVVHWALEWMGNILSANGRVPVEAGTQPVPDSVVAQPSTEDVGVLAAPTFPDVYRTITIGDGGFNERPRDVSGRFVSHRNAEALVQSEPVMNLWGFGPDAAQWRFPLSDCACFTCTTARSSGAALPDGVVNGTAWMEWNGGQA